MNAIRLPEYSPKVQSSHLLPPYVAIAANASGNTPSLRTVAGPNTGLAGPLGLAIGPR